MTPEHTRLALYIGTLALELQERRPNSVVRIRTCDGCVTLEADEIIGGRRYAHGNRRDMTDVCYSVLDPSQMGAELALRMARDFDKVEKK